MIVTTGDFYIYRHIRLDTNQIFYIGVGTKLYKSRFTHKGEYSRAYAKKGRNPYWKNITNKTNYKIEIILEFNSYQETLNKEKELIALYGRKDINTGILCNLSEGGEKGQRGRKFIMSTEQKKILSEKRSLKIFCYTLNGEFLKSFKNPKEASIELNLKRNSILYAVNNNNLHKNYLFFKKDKGNNLNFISNGKFLNPNSKKVKVITKDDKELIFNSYKEVHNKFGIDRGTIKRRVDKQGYLDLRITRLN